MLKKICLTFLLTVSMGWVFAQDTPRSNTNDDSWKRMEQSRLLSSAETWHTTTSVLRWVSCIGGIGGSAYLIYDCMSENRTMSYIVWLPLAAGTAWGIIWGIIGSSVERNLKNRAKALDYNYISSGDYLYFPVTQKQFQLGNHNLSSSIGTFYLNNKSVSMPRTVFGAGISLSL